MTDSAPAVLTERRGNVMVITLNRPEAMNAINGDLADGVVAAIRELDGDDTLTAAVLAGNGRGFCSGMDLKYFAANGMPTSLLELLTRGADKPLIAAVEGFALAGGLELALSCDLIVAGSSSKFGIPEVKVGLFAAGGGVMRLPQRLPYAVALELALTGDPIGADDAARYGLVSRVTDDGGALDGALALAARIAANAPLSVRASKQLVKASLGMGEQEFWKFQEDFVAKVFTSDDAKEGPRAFAEKRSPVWTGR